MLGITSITDDALLVTLKRQTLEGNHRLEEGRRDRVLEIEAELESVFPEVIRRRLDLCPIILDAVNFRAKVAIHKGKIAEARIHLSFVMDVCGDQPAGEWTTQFADALECLRHVAMAERDWDLFGDCLERCADVRLKVLGPHHRDTLRAVREWQTFCDIMTDPKFDGNSPKASR